MVDEESKKQNKASSKMTSKDLEKGWMQEVASET